MVNAPAFSGFVVGTVKDPVVGTEDRNLEIDYRDVLATELTQNNVALSEQNQNSFLEVMFALKDTLTGSVREWTIILKRPDEDVDVTFDINVTSLQTVQSESSERRAVLRKDSEYAYTITLVKNDGTKLKKESNLNTGDMQTEENRTVTISFEETDDDWKKQTYTETTALSEESDALTGAVDVAEDGEVAQSRDANRVDDVVADGDTAENEAVTEGDETENNDTLAGDDIVENETASVDDAEQEKPESMESDKDTADPRISDEIEHETVKTEEGEEETDKTDES